MDKPQVVTARGLRKAYGNTVVVGEFDIHVKGSGVDNSAPAKFYFDYQQSPPLWIEFEPASGSWSAIAA